MYGQQKNKTMTIKNTIISALIISSMALHGQIDKRKIHYSCEGLGPSDRCKR
jgi:hypothetical protein